MAGQPEHQLVQEQDDGVIAQRLGVSAHDAQSIVERHERLTAARQRPVGREELRDQVTHQARALLTVRRLQHCSFKGHSIPTTFKCPPAAIASAAGTLIEFGEEGIITHAITQIACILEHTFGQIKTWHRRIGMQLAHELSVLPQDGRLHIARTNHVVRHEQEFAPIRPAVAGHHIGQLRRRPRLGVACQKQIQHGHEVALTRAKTAMQVSRLAAPGLHCLLDKAQCIGKGIYQLRRNHVIAKRLLWLGHALGQLKDEVTLVHSLWDGDELSQ